MKLKEYGSWSPYNKDNPKYDPDEYNRSFIKERIECPKSFENSDFDEYYSVPKMSESFDYDKKKEDKKGRKSDNSSKIRQNMVSRVVCLAAGSVVVATSYQSVIKQQQATPPDIVPPYKQSQDIPAEDEPIELSPNWKWSDDKQTVILELLDSEGNVVEEITAVVDIVTDEPTCNKEGLATYTATAEYEEDTYTDSATETLPALGHDFDDGREVSLENGKTATAFTCDRCHEEFTFETSMSENDN